MTLEIDMQEAVALMRHLKMIESSRVSGGSFVPNFYAELDNAIDEESERVQERRAAEFYGGAGDSAYRAAMKDAGRGGQLR